MAAKSVDTLRDDVRAGKFKMTKSDSVLFGFNRKSLSDEAKAQLDSVVQSLDGVSRYVVEIQGFTDKTGSAVYNDELSQERARSRGAVSGQPQGSSAEHHYAGYAASPTVSREPGKNGRRAARWTSGFSFRRFRKFNGSGAARNCSRCGVLRVGRQTLRPDGH